MPDTSGAETTKAEVAAPAEIGIAVDRPYEVTLITKSHAKRPFATIRNENVGAGAAGGAALGAVIALGLVTGGLAVPVLGAVFGAVGGAGIGHAITRHLSSRNARVTQDSDPGVNNIV